MNEENKRLDDYTAAQRRLHTYTEGDHRKNALLMLNALGSSIRRRMIERSGRRRRYVTHQAV